MTTNGIPAFDPKEQAINIEGNEYEGCVFVREGVALSPIVTARKRISAKQDGSRGSNWGPVKIPAPPVSGWKLFRLRLRLATLYTVYSTWTFMDIGFTIYSQLVKHGAPVELRSDGLRRFINLYYRYTTTWLETWMIAIPRVLFFSWIWGSVTFFFTVCFSFKDEPDLLLSDFMDEDDYPTVDILLPRYKEPWELFLPTVRAALSMDYPPEKLHVYVCDDGDRHGCGIEKLLQSEFGTGPRMNLHYVTREDGKHAKAGNLNHCLKQSQGELVAIFDADMVSEDTFLKELIPHLLMWNESENRYVLSDTAFVQTSQCFYNEKDTMVRLMDGPNGLFYNLMLCGLNGFNGAPLVGTNFILQRAAIREIGGFVTAYSVEDVTTSCAFHQRGWTTKYKRSRLVMGLSPATLGEWFKQRLRWGAGSAQLNFYISPLTLRGLKTLLRLGTSMTHNYWMVVLITYSFMMLRFLLSLVYYYIANQEARRNEDGKLSLVPVLLLPYVIMLGLPSVSLSEKVLSISAMQTCIPVYVKITWHLMLGRLDPKLSKFLKVKASSESYGNNFPSEAYWNIIMLVVVTIGSIILCTLPHFGIGPKLYRQYYMELGFIFLWTWYSNLSVLYEVYRLTFGIEPKVYGPEAGQARKITSMAGDINGVAKEGATDTDTGGMQGAAREGATDADSADADSAEADSADADSAEADAGRRERGTRPTVLNVDIPAARNGIEKVSG